MEELNTLSERLKHARKTKGLSQAELGKAAGVSQSAIAAIESERNKGSTHIATLAAILDVNPMWLETGKGEKEIAVYQANGAQFGDNAQITGQNDFRVSQQNCPHPTEQARTHNDIMPDQSLAPVIPKGSCLWLDKEEREIEDGKIYLIEYDGIKWFRRLFRLPDNQIHIDVYNKTDNFRDYTVAKGQIRIIGRITAWKVDDL